MSKKGFGHSTRDDKYYPVRADEQGNCPLSGVKNRGNIFEKFLDGWYRFTV